MGNFLTNKSPPIQAVSDSLSTQVSQEVSKEEAAKELMRLNEFYKNEYGVENFLRFGQKGIDLNTFTDFEEKQKRLATVSRRFKWMGLLSVGILAACAVDAILDWRSTREARLALFGGKDSTTGFFPNYYIKSKINKISC